MDVISSLDDSENLMNDPEERSSTYDADVFLNRLSRRPTTALGLVSSASRDASAASSPAIRHRPSPFLMQQMEEERRRIERAQRRSQFGGDEDDGEEDIGSSSVVQSPSHSYAASFYTKLAESGVIGANALPMARTLLSSESTPTFVGVPRSEERHSVHQYQRRTAHELAQEDHGDFFREHERDAFPPNSGITAGVGPAAHIQVADSNTKRYALSSLNGFKKRDLFASHAVRQKETREKVVIDASKNPAGYHYRTTPAHVLNKDDFVEMKRKDPGYVFGPDADVNSHSHPEVRLGLHKFRPTQEELDLEVAVEKRAERMHARKLAEQRLLKDVAAKVKTFTNSQERREEETIRKQEESYRVLFQKQEEETRAKKIRPASAPFPIARRSSLSKQHKSTSSLAGLPIPDENEEIDQDTIDRQDPRTAISHPDVQLLRKQANDIAAAKELETNKNSGSRPVSATRLNVTRYADQANKAAGHTADCGPGCGHNSVGRFGGLHSQSHPTLPAGAPIASVATSLLHKHRPGSAALKIHAATPAPAPGAAVPAPAPIPEQLPVPVNLIEKHYRQEAWSQMKREEYEIDALMREMPDPALSKDLAKQLADEPDEEVVYEDSIAGAAAARMKHEARKAEKQRLKEEAKALIQQEKLQAREKLRFKTDVWESHRLGIVGIEESAADSTLPVAKARNLQLAKAGIPISKVPTHDVAFNSSVIKRKAPPPPKVRAVSVKKEASVAPLSPTSAERPSTRGSSTGKKKGPPVLKGKPASISSTFHKAQALQDNLSSQEFVHKLYGPNLASVLGAMDESRTRDVPPGLETFSMSLYRDEQDVESRQKRTRPFSAAATYNFNSGTDEYKLVTEGDVPISTVLNSGEGKTHLRETTSTLLGHSVSHPQLLKSTKARAAAVSGLLHSVHGHVQRSEALASVDSIRQSLARAVSNDLDGAKKVNVSRGVLERALVAPHVHLTPAEQRSMLPTQITNTIVNPFLVPKKKKKKKGKSGKKKGSSKKKTVGSKKVVEPEGLAFPLGTATSEVSSNPLAGDLGLINIGDLAATANEKADFRSIYLKHAQHLLMVFDFFSSRAAGGPPLMSQFAFFQFLHCIGVFNHTSGSSNMPVTNRVAYEIFFDDDDLSIENTDVDELISRPAFLERLARIAVAKCGTLKPLPKAPLGEVQPIQPKPMPPSNCLETLLLKHVIPNALSVSPGDIRMRMLDPKVQSIYTLNNIALQTIFSQYAEAKEGTVSLMSFMQMMKDCDIPPTASYVDKALRQAFSASHGDISGVTMFFPELMEVFGRIADLSGQNADLASNLSTLLQKAWTSFSQRVPDALSTAAAIAASHQAAAANATGGSKTPRVTFA